MALLHGSFIGYQKTCEQKNRNYISCQIDDRSVKHPEKHSPAILAFKKQIIDPETRARTETDVIMDLLSGHIVPRLPITNPNEQILANPQIANVAIAALRSCKLRISKDLTKFSML